LHDYALFTHRHRKGGQRRSTPCNLDTGYSRAPLAPVISGYLVGCVKGRRWADLILSPDTFDGFSRARPFHTAPSLSFSRGLGQCAGGIRVAFLALLAPEVLVVAAPPLLIVLASTFTLTYAIYAQYVAPISPILFLAAALRIVDALPPDASIVSEDHRWLVHLANRPHLYVLSARSPQADYILTNGTAMKPITNYTEKDRAAALERIRASGDYERFDCEGGYMVCAKKGMNVKNVPSTVCRQQDGQ